MPFFYKKNSTRNAIDPEKMKAAVTYILENPKASFNKTAQQFGVDRKTLSRYVDKIKNDEETNFLSNFQHSQIFSPEEEQLLQEYLILCSNLNYGLSAKATREFVYLYALEIGKNVPENWGLYKMASYDWLRGFMRRHSTLSLRTPQATSLARGSAFNRTTVSEFFNNLMAVFSKQEYSPQNVYNIDETGVTTVQKTGKIIALKGQKQISQVTSAERGTLVTMCCAINAIGSSIPPFYVFPRERKNERMTVGAPPGSGLGVHKSGWMTASNFEDYWLHFIKFSNCSKHNPVVIILDNHESHISPKGLRLCKDNGITLVTLPPHTSHKLQPLDRTVFGPFKTYYNAALTEYMATHPAQTIDIYKIPQLTATAFLKAFNPVNIQKGFKCTGIWPLNSDIFSDNDFLSSYVTDRPNIEESNDTNNATNESTGSQSSGSSHSISITSDERGVKKRPEEVRPLPKGTARKNNRARKRIVSRILTDDSVIAEINEEYEARQIKKQKILSRKEARAEKQLEKKLKEKVAVKSKKK